MPRVSVENSNRFTLEILPVEKARLVRAASLMNTSLKDFMVANSLRAADTVIDRAERITLNEEQRRFVVDLLDNPPAPNAKLLAAAQLLAAQG